MVPRVSVGCGDSNEISTTSFMSKEYAPLEAYMHASVWKHVGDNFIIHITCILLCSNKKKDINY